MEPSTADTSRTLRSLFNGEVVTFPPETSLDTIDALLRSGMFTRPADDEDRPRRLTRKRTTNFEEIQHGEG